jgi:hypothetical protein
MGVIHGPNDIVEDGLILMVDAADPQSFMSGDTHVNSLVGGFIGRLIGPSGSQPYPRYSPEGGGSWLFDGTDDYVEFTGFTGNMGRTTGATYDIHSYSICTFAKSTEADGHATIFGFSKGYSAYGVLNQQFWFSSATPTNAVRTFVGGECPHGVPGCGTVPWGTFAWYQLETVLEQWNYYCTVITPNHITQYFNESTQYDSPSTANVARRNEFIQFWMGTRGDAYWRGYMGPMLVYNRALSTREVKQNYNAFKGRYGL